MTIPWSFTASLLHLSSPCVILYFMDLLLANVLGYCNPAPKLRQASHNFLHLAVRYFGAIAAEHNTVRTRCSAQWLKSESVIQLQDLRSDGVTLPHVVAVQVLIVFHNSPHLECCIFHTHILCLVSIDNNCVQTQIRVSDVLKDSCTLTILKHSLHLQVPKKVPRLSWNSNSPYQIILCFMQWVESEFDTTL